MKPRKLPITPCALAAVPQGYVVQLFFTEESVWWYIAFFVGDPLKNGPECYVNLRPVIGDPTTPGWHTGDLVGMKANALGKVMRVMEPAR